MEETGKKTGGENAVDPIAAYPGHMAPDGLLFYTGAMFPEKYRHGAFIAFHGSWNRAPEKQKGYFVVFQPFKNGRPDGNWEVFADNFAGSDNISSPRTSIAPALRSCTGTRWSTVCFRRCKGKYLQNHL